MIYKKYTLFIVLFALLFVCFTTTAQQQGLYSQYMMNYYLVNPGAAGTTNNLDVRAGYRMQWVGLSGSPRNYYLSATYPIKKMQSKLQARKMKHHYQAIGGSVSGQSLGLLSHNGGHLTYAYHLMLSKDWTLSMGANVGYSQISLNSSAANWGDNISDPSNYGPSTLNIDGALGFWLYSDQAFFGLSSTQLFQGDISFSPESSKGILNRHFYATGGFIVPLSEDMNLVPSLMLRNTATALQLDLNAKIKFKDLYWAGVSYRKTDAVLAMVGMAIPFSDKIEAGRIEIGYSYDVVTSRLSPYTGGSHEIALGLVLPKHGHVICPTQFW